MKLEELKEEVAAPQFIRIVESLQAAVEKIPISQAFDELDNETEILKNAWPRQRLCRTGWRASAGLVKHGTDSCVGRPAHGRGF